MTFRDAVTGLTPGAHGIPEPDSSAPQIDADTLDALLVPGVAFTRSGVRLGQGGGFYDRFIPKMRPDAPRIGLCHSWQVVDDLPAEPHDVRVTHVVTEKETFVTGA
jgi:5-formyltetrahydrofolate cyclo-ligase